MNINKNFNTRTQNAGIGVRGTEFSVEYTGFNGIGTTTIAVTEGQVAVDMGDHSVPATLVNAGETKSFTSLVNRPKLLLPAATSFLNQNANIHFSCTAYPGAGKYLFEGILYPGIFNPAESATTQNNTVTMTIEPSQYSVQDGVVDWPLFLPANALPADSIVSWRIFPLNANGQILSGTTSSSTGVIGFH